jgi:hypothetical protein
MQHPVKWAAGAGLLFAGALATTVLWTPAAVQPIDAAGVPPPPSPQPTRDALLSGSEAPPDASRSAHDAEPARMPESLVSPHAESAADLVSWLERVKPGLVDDLTEAQVLALTELDLRGATITDDDLAFVVQLTNLKNLSLYGTPVSDAGLQHLAGLAQLERVVLRGTQVTGTGLQHLPTQNLTALHLCASQITAEDLRFTPVMPNLQTLKLNFLELDDSVVEMLNVYPALRHIELDQSQITDAGLAQLLSLNPGLTRVELRNTKVTGEGIAELSALHPDCEFVEELPTATERGAAR